MLASASLPIEGCGISYTNNMTDLSIIIISYNTRKLTEDCLNALQTSLKKSQSVSSEIIVVDNASSDDSVAMLRKRSDIHLIINKKNLGFGAANNLGIEKARGRFILFLNSDVIADAVNFKDLIAYMEADDKIGVLSVRVHLADGSIDPASHRGFPTIWRSFSYYSKLEFLTQKIPLLSRLFGGYHLAHLNRNTIHEIDSPTAAFYLTRKDILDSVGGFDSAFFMYGEDLDLSYRIKHEGFKIIYYPKFTVIHLKHQSGLKHHVDSVQTSTKKHFYNAMKIFYDKHYAPKNLSLINQLVHLAINIKSKL